MLTLGRLSNSVACRRFFASSSSTFRNKGSSDAVFTASKPSERASAKPLKKILVANRGEIAVRVFRACNELGIRSVAIFAHEDRVSAHRYKADESYLVGQGLGQGAVAPYLSIEHIVRVAKDNGVDGIHPGYGFLSESAEFARQCRANGIKFIGPPAEVIEAVGNKTAGRLLAEAAGVPIIPGSSPLATVDEALEFGARVRYPIILKAASGGGGRGMRVVTSPDELPLAFERCKSEALAFFGDPTVFAEKYLVKPRHIEVQVLADEHGHVVHLYERDCSVQRRYQKVVESAPAVSLDERIRAKLLHDAVLLASTAHYQNAGTFEFLVTADGYYFCEANPRVQVEHTVTEEITGIDIVQSQIRIAEGYSLADIGLGRQEDVQPRGFAIQCRITTEDPQSGFRPAAGTISVYRSPGGSGIRLDGGNSFAGAVVTPHYDSLLVKLIAHSLTWESTLHKTARALREFRVRGVSTNIPFLLQVIGHDKFKSGVVDTGFIDEHPELLEAPPSLDRANKLLAYFADVAVNGPQIAGMASDRPPVTMLEPPVPALPAAGAKTGTAALRRAIFKQHGAAAFAKAVRDFPNLMVMDTTWRDAHQSLLATRVRTRDMLRAAPLTRHVLRNAYSLECWGGATFDVALRFLHECPWDRLEALREAVPDIPFQMLLRGANGLAYSSNADNVIYRFTKQAVKSGMDIFRVFDSLNYMDNLRVGMDAVGEAGGIIEGTIAYTGDVASADHNSKYSLDYYLDLARQIVAAGAHVLAIKDMAGLLTVQSAQMLVGALRSLYPDVPIHVHTHDSAGLGTASMLAAARAGADVVDCAVDALSGLTSQPSLGALIASHQGDIGVDLHELIELNDYWDHVRQMYRPFETGQLATNADVVINQIPGGQYSSLLFQANSLGLAGHFPAIKRAYAEVNAMLGDIIKVTPSSKVVGDVAQFMIQNKLSAAELVDKAATLSLPSSLVEFLRGDLGQPVGGFPEPLRSRVLESRGLAPLTSRPGANTPPLDFDALRARLQGKHGRPMSEKDLLSATAFPQVFDEYVAFTKRHGDLSVVPTPYFLHGLPYNQEANVELEKGKQLIITLEGISAEADNAGMRAVSFNVNGEARRIIALDRSVAKNLVKREQAQPDQPGSVGAPLQSLVKEVSVKVGDRVKPGQSMAILSAMKMETSLTAPIAGVVKRIVVQAGDNVGAGDLLIEIAAEAQ